jgi:hypothetical protein
MKRLLNRSEEDVLKALNAAVAEYGLRVNAKVRVADVCPIERCGVSDDLYGYALKAHFDFLVTDENHQPKFAVEFDGAGHDPAGDHKKDAICRFFEFPLLRIKINWLPKRYRDLSVLEWVIDVYHLGQGWDEAQAKGEVPFDDVFDPFAVVAGGRTGKRFPYWISATAQIGIKKLYKEGKIASPYTCGFVGEDNRGNLKAIEFLRVNETLGIVETSGMRPPSFSIVLGHFGELLGQLLTIFLYERLQEYLVSGSGLTPLATIYRLFEKYRSRLKMHSGHSSGDPLGGRW